MITSFKSCRPDQFMKKAKIYIPTKNSMQSGLGKSDKWLIEFETERYWYKSFDGLGDKL